MSYQLQSIRIPSDWKTCINNLYDVDPSPETIDWFMASCLFDACNDLNGYSVEVIYTEDVGFEVSLFHRSDYKTPIQRKSPFRTVYEEVIQNRLEMVEKIEELMSETLKFDESS